MTGLVARLRAAGCVFAEDEARLLIESATTPEELAAAVEQRVAGTPLEQVLGWAEFRGLRITVEPGVFVPRRRTEPLAARAAALTAPGAIVVDLCCGSGAVGASIAAELAGHGHRVDLLAVDIEPAAVRCARRNLAAHGGRVYLGDLYTPLPAELAGRVDVLVANAPYVPEAELGLMPHEAREHEPRVTHDGGSDGLAVLRRIIGGAPRWLAPGGHLLTESGRNQAPAVAELMAGARFVPRLLHDRELDATVVVGTRAQQPGASPPPET